MSESDNFFLDIFNKLLKINDESIMIIFDVDGNIWFKFRDLLKALGYTDINHTIKDIKISDDNKEYYKNIRVCGRPHTPKNMQPMYVFINEPGLYEVLSVSTKPLAKLFMKKYYTEIMPSIRKYGIYAVVSEDKQNLNLLNQKIDKLKEKVTNLSDENNYLDSKHRFQKSSKGYAYINQTICIHKGVKIKCYKFGVDTNMKTRTSSYKTGELIMNNIFYIIHYASALDQSIINMLKHIYD